MNCKPGDLAICIADARSGFNGHTISWPTSGRIVKVVSFELGRWSVEESITLRGRFVCCGGHGFAIGEVTHLSDEILRPLPPISEDEHDQVEKLTDEIADQIVSSVRLF